MIKTVRVGLIGTSWYSDFAYYPALKSHLQTELVAICGRDQVRAQELAVKYAVPQVFADYRQMIAQANLDAVIVVSPDDLHYEMTMVALDAGLHVLCEKPLAMNAHQAREMAEKAKAVGVKHMVMYTWRGMPAIRYLHDLVADGYVGRIYHSEFNFVMGYGREPGYQWRIDRSRSNGVLGDLGSHIIDMARWMVGDIASVSASLATYFPHLGPFGGMVDSANDSAYLIVDFSNGAHGVMQTTWLAHQGDYLRVSLYGAAGSLEVNCPCFSGEKATIRGARSQDEKWQILELPEFYVADSNPADAFSVLHNPTFGPCLFVDAILADQPITPNFWDGYKNQLVIDAAIESNAKRAAVGIPPV